MPATRSKILVGAAITAVAMAATTVPASAHPAKNTPKLKVVKTISSAYVGPLQFAVAEKSIFVADSFTSTLNLVGRSRPLATGPDPATGGDIAGVAVDPHTGAVAYTSANGTHTSTKLTIMQKGKKPVVADLSWFEKKYNPDKGVHYGIDHPSKCVRDTFAALPEPTPVQYSGLKDSHPYAVAAIGNGAWAVADAGGNDILKVDRQGHISLLKVLPRQGVKITKAFAAANGVKSCAVGFTYNFEAVPTDVEMRKDGTLFVTTLPGGPEGPGNGNPGSVYAISAHHRYLTKMVTGFNGATNIALDSKGNMFVAEISSGTISQVIRGKRTPVLTLPGVVAVEYANGHLYASTAPAVGGVQAPGSIVQLG